MGVKELRDTVLILTLLIVIPLTMPLGLKLLSPFLYQQSVKSEELKKATQALDDLHSRIEQLRKENKLDELPALQVQIDKASEKVRELNKPYQEAVGKVSRINNLVNLIVKVLLGLLLIVLSFFIPQTFFSASFLGGVFCIILPLRLQLILATFPAGSANINFLMALGSIILLVALCYVIFIRERMRLRFIISTKSTARDIIFAYICSAGILSAFLLQLSGPAYGPLVQVIQSISAITFGALVVGFSIMLQEQFLRYGFIIGGLLPLLFNLIQLKEDMRFDWNQQIIPTFKIVLLIINIVAIIKFAMIGSYFLDAWDKRGIQAVKATIVSTGIVLFLLMIVSVSLVGLAATGYWFRLPDFMRFDYAPILKPLIDLGIILGELIILTILYYAFKFQKQLFTQVSLKEFSFAFFIYLFASWLVPVLWNVFPRLAMIQYPDKVAGAILLASGILLARYAVSFGLIMVGTFLFSQYIVQFVVSHVPHAAPYGLLIYACVYFVLTGIINYLLIIREKQGWQAIKVTLNKATIAVSFAAMLVCWHIGIVYAFFFQP